jgi:hypothetical protein
MSFVLQQSFASNDGPVSQEEQASIIGKQSASTIPIAQGILQRSLEFANMVADSATAPRQEDRIVIAVKIQHTR